MPKPVLVKLQSGRCDNLARLVNAKVGMDPEEGRDSNTNVVLAPGIGLDVRMCNGS